MSSSRITPRRSRRSSRQRASSSIQRSMQVPVNRSLLRIAGTINCSSTAATSVALAPALSGSNDWASFAALYDEFKLDRVDIALNFGLIMSQSSTAAGIYSGVASAIDPNYSAAVTYANLSDYQNYRLHPVTTVAPFVRRAWPAPAPHDVTTNAMLTEWQPVDNIGNIGFHTFLLATAATVNTSGSAQIPYVLTYHVSFRMRR